MKITLCIIGYVITVIIAAAIFHIIYLPTASEFEKDNYVGDIALGLFWPIVLVIEAIAWVGKLAIILTKLLEKQMLFYLNGRKEFTKNKKGEINEEQFDSDSFYN